MVSLSKEFALVIFVLLAVVLTKSLGKSCPPLGEERMIRHFPTVYGLKQFLLYKECGEAEGP